MFFRKEMVDFYNPTFASLGEMAVKNKEIYANLPYGNTTSSGADGVFGYQEAWAEYRFSPNRVSGDFRSSLTASLDSWHYADNYQSQPTLSAGWIRTPPYIPLAAYGPFVVWQVAFPPTNAMEEPPSPSPIR